MKWKFLIGLAVLSHTVNGLAQVNVKPDTTSKELGRVVIFSSPYEAKKQMPVSYSRIDSVTIRLLDYGAEPSSLLQRFPGTTYTTDNGTDFGYSYFRFRGLDQSRINITVNGMPLNETEDAGVSFSNFSGLLSDALPFNYNEVWGLAKIGAPAFAGALISKRA
jgi:iron complex outermembrane receptor protein